MYNVLDYLKESARKYPDKVAFADIDQSITYKELYSCLLYTSDAADE